MLFTSLGVFFFLYVKCAAFALCIQMLIPTLVNFLMFSFVRSSPCDCNWAEPVDLHEGFLVKGTMPQAADMINLGFLSEAEQELILEVLRRDEELRQNEEHRVRWDQSTSCQLHKWLSYFLSYFFSFIPM